MVNKERHHIYYFKRYIFNEMTINNICLPLASSSSSYKFDTIDKLFISDQQFCYYVTVISDYGRHIVIIVVVVIVVANRFYFP